MAKALDQIKALLDTDGAQYQMLHTCADRADYSAKKGHTMVTFGTSCADPFDALEAKNKVGIIVWVDRKEFDRVIAEGKAK